MKSTSWPVLPIGEWKDTCATLHLWTQIVGKIRTRLMPWTNHSWHVTFYVTPRGLTTLSIPYESLTFQIDFDFMEHQLTTATSDGRLEAIPLEPMSVAEFFRRVMSVLSKMDMPLTIHSSPNEVDPAIPFAEDEEHASYDTDYVRRFHQTLVQADRIMKRFRAGFLGKCSPVHFFWGSFDLAVTRFSGRPAPQHPGGFPNMPDWITREAYSHEVSSCGFWPGGGDNDPFFYSYAYPTPNGYAEQPVRPGIAHYSRVLGEFILPYEAIRNSSTPDADLLAFFQSTYEAAANQANWDRKFLEWNGPQRV